MKVLGAFSLSVISAITSLLPVAPETENRTCNGFLEKLVNNDELIPFLAGNSLFHCFAPPETTDNILRENSSSLEY